MKTNYLIEGERISVQISVFFFLIVRGHTVSDLLVNMCIEIAPRMERPTPVTMVRESQISSPLVVTEIQA